MIIVITLCSEWVQKNINSMQYYFQFRFHCMKTEKLMHTDYCNIDSSKGMNMDQKAGYGQECENIVYDLSEFLKDILGILTYGGILIFQSVWILIILLITTLINYFSMEHARNYQKKNVDNWMGLDRKLNYINTISFDYHKAKDIKIYGMADWLKKLFFYYQKKRLAWNKKVMFRWTVASILEVITSFIRESLTYIILLYMILNHKISIGDFLFLFSAVAGFSGWFNSIAKQINNINTKNLTIKYFREFLDMEEKYNHGKGERVKNCSTGLKIDLEDVSFRYEGASTPTIDNMNLTINSGERLAIVGENGSGKTTLIKLICGLYFPSKGTVYVNGYGSTRYNIEDYYSLFSPVFQDIFTIGISIERFVGSSSGEEKIDRDRINEIIDLVELTSCINRLPKGINTVLCKGVYEDSVDLSGGETQKLMLARALYKDAPIVILDEPTAALDPIAESRLYDQFNKITENKTAIFISHRLSSTRFCDRIIFLKNGKVIESGTHEELMLLNGEYSQMFNVQSRLYKEGIGNE